MNEQDSEVPTTDDADNPAPPQVPLIRWPIYRGWWIALAGAGIVTLTTYANSDIANYVFEPVGSGGSSAAVPVAIGTAASLLLLLPFRPLVGHFVDRRGPLVPVTAALLIGGLHIYRSGFHRSELALLQLGDSGRRRGGRDSPHCVVDDSCSTCFPDIWVWRFAVSDWSAYSAKPHLLPSIFIGGMLFIALVGSVAIYEYGPIQYSASFYLPEARSVIAGLAFVYVLRRWPLWTARRGLERRGFNGP